MSKTLVGGATETVAPISNNLVTQIVTFEGIAGIGIESNVLFSIGIPGTMSLLGVHWDGPGAGVSRTLTLRKNIANANEIVTDTTGVDGWYYDTSHTDSLVKDDKICILFNESGTSSNFFGNTSIFEANSGATVSLIGSAIINITSQSGTYYSAFVGINSGTTESDMQCLIRAPGVHILSYFQLTVATAAGSTRTGRFRKNNADGNSFVSVTASTTGIFVDTTNTDTFTLGDLICFSGGVFSSDTAKWGFGANVTWNYFKYDTGQGSAIGSDRAASANIDIYPLKGFATLSTPGTDASAKLAFKYSGNSLSNIRTNSITNTYAASSTLRLRKNGANATQAITIPNGATGWLEDTTNSDAFNADDLWTVSITGGTSGNLFLQTWLITVDNGGVIGQTYPIASMNMLGASFSQRVRSIGY